MFKNLDLPYVFLYVDEVILANDFSSLFQECFSPWQFGSFVVDCAERFTQWGRDAHLRTGQAEQRK